MSEPVNSEETLENLLVQLRACKKYHGMPEETLRDILADELRRQRKPAEALKNARAHLHNVLAPYLGDLDYRQARKDLEEAAHASPGSQTPLALRALCETFLYEHDSTHERLPYLSEFYEQIFGICGPVKRVLDLACGLNPFALPWMGLPAGVAYHAYELIDERVALINQFLRASGREGLAEVRDILVRPPDIEADAAFLFKEAHRLEKRQKGCNRRLWAALRVRLLFVSLPNRSLDGQRDLRERMRQLVKDNLAFEPAEMGELEFPGETVFWMRKQAETGA